MGKDFLCSLMIIIMFTSSSTHITLQCDSDEEGRLESVKEPVTSNDDFLVVSSGKFNEKNIMDMSDENY